MRERFARFMMGRYGNDTLNKYLLGLALILMLAGSFVNNRIPILIAWALVVLIYFRMFSRNVYKRSHENQVFLNKTYGIRKFFHNRWTMLKQRRTYHFYKCPQCKQRIRIPRGKGRIEIRCPKCSNTFVKKS